MEKGRNKRSLALWFTIAILVSQNIVSPVMSQGFEDEKNFFPAPDPGYGSTPPSFGYPSPFPSGGGTPPSTSYPSPLPSGGGTGTPPSGHGSGSSPHGNPGHGGSGGTGNCGNPPSHGSSGGSHTPTPSHGSGGGSYNPSPSHGSSGGSHDPSPSHGSHTPTPSHGSGGGSHTPTPSHGSGGGSHTPTPSHGSGGGSYTPTTPSTPSYTPTPSTPTVTPTPSTPSIIPGIPSIPGILPNPSPLFPDPHSSPSPGTCSYWRSHPDLIWSLLGWWGSVGSMFKLPSSGTSSFPGSSLTIPQALSNTRHDGIGALYREGTASLLNSMANSKFPYTTEEVRDRFVAALGSDSAASAQAQLFKLANEGRLKPRA